MKIIYQNQIEIVKVVPLVTESGCPYFEIHLKDGETRSSSIVEMVDGDMVFFGPNQF